MAPLVVFVDEPGLTAAMHAGFPLEPEPHDRPRVERAGHHRAPRRHRSALLRPGRLARRAPGRAADPVAARSRRGAVEHAGALGAFLERRRPGRLGRGAHRRPHRLHARSACGSTSRRSGARSPRAAAIPSCSASRPSSPRPAGSPCTARPRPTSSSRLTNQVARRLADPDLRHAPHRRRLAASARGHSAVGTIGRHAGQPPPRLPARARHDELSRLVRDARYRYYVLSDLAMPDAEFDARLHELEAIEARVPGAAARPTRRPSRWGRRSTRPSRRSSTSRRCSRSTTCSARTTCGPGRIGCVRGLPAGTDGPLGVRAEDRRHRHQLRVPRRRARGRRHPRHRARWGRPSPSSSSPSTTCPTGWPTTTRPT